MRVLRLALRGGEGDLPSADADGLVTATSQFIDDMEDQAAIIDRFVPDEPCSHVLVSAVCLRVHCSHACCSLPAPSGVC